MAPLKKKKVTRRRVKLEKVGTGRYGKHIFGLYEPGTIGEEALEPALPEFILRRGKELVFHKSTATRRGALKEVMKLRKRGIPAFNFQVRKGRVVLWNVIYKEKH